MGGFCPACVARMAFDTTWRDAEAPVTGERDVLHRFGDYEILEEIGRGGMGVVYRARQVSLNRLVAVKMILSGPFASREDVRRFRAEAEAVAGLRHPHIVSIHEVGEVEGQQFFSMEYVEDGTLADLVRGAPLSPKEAARVVLTLAGAIGYAHEQGVIHRDLKPSNILIDDQNQLKVTDFGLAKRLTHDSNLTLSGQVLGSPNFSPPEQAGGQGKSVGFAGDVYSLGAILYYLLTGRPPFMAESVELTLSQVVNVDPPAPGVLNPDVPRDLDTICLKCLEKEPHKRFRSARELGEELQLFLDGRPILTRPVGVVGRAGRWCRRNPVLAGLGATVLLLTLAILVGSPVALFRIGESRDQARSEAESARRNLYAADMNLAREAYNNGNVRRALSLLNKHLPEPGGEDLRGFAWRHLWRLCREGDASRTFHYPSNRVLAAVFPTRDLLASVTAEGEVRLSNTGTGREEADFSIGRTISTASFSSDGSLLTTGDMQGVVTLWDVSGQKEIQSLSFDYPIHDTTLSPDNGVLGVSFMSVGESTVLWSVTESRRLASLPYTGGRLSFSRSGTLLAKAGPALEVRFWDTATVRELEPIEEAHDTTVTGVALSPDGRRMATCGWDTSIRLWDLGNRRLLSTLRGHQSHVRSIVFSPDGETLASAGADATVKLWRVGQPSGRELEAFRTFRGHTDQVRSIVFSKDGLNLASVGEDHTVRLWPVGEEARPDTLVGNDWMFTLALTTDGRMVAAGSFDGSVRLWDLESQEVMTIPDAHRLNVLSAAFSADGTTLATSEAVWRVNRWRGLNFTTPGAVKLWKTGSGEPILSLPGFTTGIRAVAFSPDNRMLATGDHDGILKLWELPGSGSAAERASSGLSLKWERRKEDVPVPNGGIKGRIRRIIFLPDSSSMVLLYQRISAELVYLESRDPGMAFGQPEDWMYALAVSSDGRLLAGGTGSVKVWDIASGQLVAEFQGHDADILCASFSPDGRTLATGSVDSTVKLWRLDIGQEVATLKGHRGPVSDASFAKDGSLLASCSEDGTVRLWRAASLAEADR